MEVRLRLVRHGATAWSDARRLNGWTDVPLNPEGREQARRLRSVIQAVRPTMVFTSDLARARETAEIAAGTANVDLRLREFNFGRWEGRRWEEISHSEQQAMAAFDSVEASGGESMVGFRRRIASFLGDLQVDRCVIVTHGGVIRALRRGAGLSSMMIPPGTHPDVTIAPGRLRSDDGAANTSPPLHHKRGERRSIESWGVKE
jgi:2,3-bisphosphoglycerate-dependent phosphoglycerate mutase